MMTQCMHFQSHFNLVVLIGSEHDREWSWKVAISDAIMQLTCCLLLTAFGAAGKRIANVILTLAAAYRKEQDSASLPEPLVARDLWPWHLTQALPHTPADNKMQKGSLTAQHGWASQVRL